MPIYPIIIIIGYSETLTKGGNVMKEKEIRIAISGKNEGNFYQNTFYIRNDNKKCHATNINIPIPALGIRIILQEENNNDNTNNES